MCAFSCSLPSRMTQEAEDDIVIIEDSDDANLPTSSGNTPAPEPAEDLAAVADGPEAVLLPVPPADSLLATLINSNHHQQQVGKLLEEMTLAYRAQKNAWRAIENYYSRCNTK